VPASDAQCWSLMHRHNVRDWRVAIEYGDGFTTAHGAEVFAQPRFELGDAHLLHDHIMTTNDHIPQWEVNGRRDPHCHGGAGSHSRSGFNEFFKRRRPAMRRPEGPPRHRPAKKVLLHTDYLLAFDTTKNMI
jgi:hypothetical protein